MPYKKGNQKGISHKGKGKWQTYDSLAKYRNKRDKAKREARQKRMMNRA